jgi:hypothetical protein
LLRTNPFVAHAVDPTAKAVSEPTTMNFRNMAILLLTKSGEIARGIATPGSSSEIGAPCPDPETHP